MAMIKKGISFPQTVVEVIDGTCPCEKCSKPLNLMLSQNGIVICESCGHSNKVKDMEQPADVE
jgi:Zn finger protein HypA/HybF involved in hydrogenase expression